MLLFFAFEYVLLELEVIRVSYRYLICLIAHRLAARNNGGEWANRPLYLMYGKLGVDIIKVGVGGNGKGGYQW